jgi:predicted transcriptional regulator
MDLSGRELDVMNVLWERGSATVSEVLEELPDELAYTTVLTILRRLEDKGHVRHDSEGKAHRYLPLLEREDVQDSAIQRMTRKLFRDSPRLLMTRLLGRGELSPDQLRELRTLLDQRLEDKEEER